MNSNKSSSLLSAHDDLIKQIAAWDNEEKFAYLGLNREKLRIITAFPYRLDSKKLEITKPWALANIITAWEHFNDQITYLKVSCRLPIHYEVEIASMIGRSRRKLEKIKIKTNGESLPLIGRQLSEMTKLGEIHFIAKEKVEVGETLQYADREFKTKLRFTDYGRNEEGLIKFSFKLVEPERDYIDYEVGAILHEYIGENEDIGYYTYSPTYSAALSDEIEAMNEENEIDE